MHPFQKMTNNVMENCVRVFGETVSFKPKNGSSFFVRGIFDNESELIDPATGAVVISNQPLVGFKNSDLNQRPNVGDEVTIRNLVYLVVETMEDGQAGTRLRLHLKA